MRRPLAFVLAALLATPARAQEPPLYLIQPFTMEKLRAAVARGLDVNTPDGPGGQWMYQAAYDGNSEALEYLLRRGAPVDVTGRMGWTALYILAYMSHRPNRDNLGSARTLVAHGARVDWREPRERNTPLLALSSGGDPELARYLIERGADPNARNAYDDSPLALAIDTSRDNAKLIRILLSGGAKPAAPHHFRSRVHSGGATALHLAAYKGDVKTVALMLKLKSSPNVPNDVGWSPVRVAALRDGNAEVVRLLMKAGGSATKPDESGDTPVEMAMRRHNVRVLAVFRQFGVNPTAKPRR